MNQIEFSPLLVAEAEKELYCDINQIAWLGHRGQFRRNGTTPYIEHPKEVARELRKDGYNLHVQCLGLIHDLKEDCESLVLWAAYDMLFIEACKRYQAKAGMLPEFFNYFKKIDVLTHNKDEKSYEKYINDIKEAGFPYVDVKIRDIRCNQKANPSEKKKRLYKEALELLKD